MLYRPITDKDELYTYQEDIEQCYKDNPQIADYQSVVDFQNTSEAMSLLESYIDCDESAILGIYDDNETYLFGFIIFDGIRLTDDGNAAQVHICISRDIWGKEFQYLYEKIMDDSIFDTLYAMIPSRCRGAITLCKKLGFKKTGYIPKAIPYTTLKGEVKMFDELIYTYYKEKKTNG